MTHTVSEKDRFDYLRIQGNTIVMAVLLDKIKNMKAKEFDFNTLKKYISGLDEYVKGSCYLNEEDNLFGTVMGQRFVMHNAVKEYGFDGKDKAISSALSALHKDLHYVLEHHQDNSSEKQLLAAKLENFFVEIHNQINCEFLSGRGERKYPPIPGSVPISQAAARNNGLEGALRN